MLVILCLTHIFIHTMGEKKHATEIKLHNFLSVTIAGGFFGAIV